MQRILNSILINLTLMMSFTSAGADIERRKDQFGKEFGYYIYPIVGEIQQ